MKNFQHTRFECATTIFLGSVLLSAGCTLLFVPAHVEGAFGDCPAGYFFDRMSGVGCKQTHCAEVQDAHWSYEGRCVCGSSGSENEDPKGPNKECYLPHTDTSCPDCVVRCVHHDEACPGDFGIKGDAPLEAPTGVEDASLFEYVKDAFGQLVSIGTDLFEAATSIVVKDTTTTDEFYTGRVILTDGDTFDVRLFHSNFEWSDEKGIAFEFNLVEIKTPSNTAWIDNWSIGVGIGSVSKDGISPPVPYTPISPGISFRNIGNWFSEQYTDIRVWYRDNAPWYLGGDEPSPVGGMHN